MSVRLSERLGGPANLLFLPLYNANRRIRAQCNRTRHLRGAQRLSLMSIPFTTFASCPPRSLRPRRSRLMTQHDNSTTGYYKSYRFDNAGVLQSCARRIAQEKRQHHSLESNYFVNRRSVKCHHCSINVQSSRRSKRINWSVINVHGP